MRQRSSRRSNLYAAAHSVRCWPRAISVSPIDILRGALRASLTRRKPRGTSQPAIRCSLGATYCIARQSRSQRGIAAERSAVAGVKARLRDQEISPEQFYQPQTSGNAGKALRGANTGRVMQMPFNKTHVAVGRREPTIRLAVRLRSRWPRASWGDSGCRTSRCPSHQRIVQSQRRRRLQLGERKSGASSDNSPKAPCGPNYALV